MSAETGRTERFLALLMPLRRSLEVYCRRALFDLNEVEDALQSVVANAFEKFARFEPGTNFRAWIFRFLNLEVRSRNRKTAGRSTEALVEDPANTTGWEQSVFEGAFDDLLGAAEDVLDHCDDELSNAVRRMPETEQSVFLLRALGEFSYREISEILKMPIGTVMSGLSRGRAMLRQRLAEFARDAGLRPRTTSTEDDT